MEGARHGRSSRGLEAGGHQYNLSHPQQQGDAYTSCSTNADDGDFFVDMYAKGRSSKGNYLAAERNTVVSNVCGGCPNGRQI